MKSVSIRVLQHEVEREGWSAGFYGVDIGNQANVSRLGGILAAELDIAAGSTGTLSFVPKGERVEGAVDALIEYLQTHIVPSNAIFSGNEVDRLVAAARAELALREPEMIVEISESGKIISTIQRLTTESEGLRAGRYAIRKFADAPKPKVRPWRLRTTRWMCPKCNHRAPAGSDRCGHCQTLFDQAHPRDLPGAEE